ncbi:MAG: hypothetical protein JSS71_10705 [Armatimonadetes bacterium]|nr:hypothetical protein [Armatimonadota bacterium]
MAIPQTVIWVFAAIAGPARQIKAAQAAFFPHFFQLRIKSNLKRLPSPQ